MFVNPLKAQFERIPGLIRMPSRGEVHVWSFRECKTRMLSEDEDRRAEGFVDPTAKSAFVRGRSGLRDACASYLSIDPSDVRIAIAASGKPFFADSEELHFNLSHSGDHVLAAFSSEEIGIDIENPARCPDFRAIAKRFFLPAESKLIEAAGDSGRELFFRIWTAKEAIVKLSGHGLASGIKVAESNGGTRGILAGREVFIQHFSWGELSGAIASFSPFAVKGWFDL